MIPKIIHYVWCGDKEKSELTLRCIASWKKYCPDYHIKEWGNEEVGRIRNAYLQEAFAVKKWAFASDYVRLYALATEGGVYLDTDLELTGPLDRFLEHSFFGGYEEKKWVATSVIGAEQGNPIIRGLLSLYDDLHFVGKDGELDMTTNVFLISRFLRENYEVVPERDSQRKTEFSSRCVLYPAWYFSAPENGKENYGIHHFSTSWLDSYGRKIKCQFGRFKLIRFEINRGFGREKDFPLMSYEKMLFCIQAKKGKFYGLVSTNRDILDGTRMKQGNIEKGRV